jgi:hypothetical protein
MSKKTVFEKAQARIESMDELGRFVMANWSDYCLNAWRNSPDQQGDFDPERCPIITLGAWRDDDTHIKISYSHGQYRFNGEAYKGWLCNTNFILRHDDLKTRNSYHRRWHGEKEKTLKKTYWFEPSTYFKGTGFRVQAASRSVHEFYPGEEQVFMQFFVLEKDWPQLANSWDQMQVMKLMCPDDSKQLPDFIS